MSIQSLMNAKPYHNEPGFEVAQDPRDVENYNDCICFEKMNVAVCEMVGDNTMSQAMPEHLRILARDLFPSFYDAHLLTCSNLIERGKDGKLMIDPFGENRGSMQFSKVRARLEALNQLLSDGNSQSLNFETTISSTGPLGYIGAAAEEVAAGVAKK
jgi:ubiquitin-conjugating enzyme E2 Z